MSRGGAAIAGSEPRSPSAPRLLLRTVRADASVSMLVAVLTLLVAVVAGIVPRAMDQLAASDLHYAGAELSDPLRDVKGVLQTFPGGSDPGYSESSQDALQHIYGRLDAALADWRSSQRQPLRGILQQPLYVVRMAERTPAKAPAGATPQGNLWLRAAVDPGYLKHIAIVEGAAPKAPATPAADDAAAGDDARIGAPAEHRPPLQMVVSVATAKTMGIAVGDVLATEVLGDVRISGLFEPKDAGGDYWSNTPSMTDAEVFDDGNRTPDFTGTGFIDPVALAQIIDSGAELTTTMWYPVAAGAVTAGTARAVAAGIRGVNQNQLSVPSRMPGVTALVTMRSHLDEAIDASLSRVAATVALLSICVSGPIGVVLAVFALAVRAVVERRAAPIALASARGASPLQLRGTAAAEGLAIGLPAALAGAVIAALLLPDAGGAAAWIVPLVFGCVPAALFAALGGRRAFRTTRRDLSARTRGGIRTAVAVGLIVMAGLAAFLLVRRGRISAPGVDPLLALTPLLLALAASVIVLWVLPPALHAAATIARRGRGPVAFVGSARALRDPALGVAAALAVVVGISVAVFSSVVLATVESSARAQAQAAVGADVRASGTIFTAAQQRAVAGIDGVASVAPVASAGQLSLGHRDRTDAVAVVLTNAQSLHVQRPEVPLDLATKSDGRIPVLVSSDVGDDTQVGDDLTLGLLEVRVAGILPDDSGFGVDAPWVLADEAFATDVGMSSFTPATLLIEVRPGADAARVASAVREGMPTAVVDDVASELAAVQAVPTAAGLRATLIAAVFAGALLAALAVFAGSVTASASRNMSIGMLRTMGLSARQSLGLVAWEIVPVVAVATIVGTALGLAMPSLVVATTDLSGFTGGASAPAVSADAAQLALVLLAFLAVTAVATLVAVLTARRAAPATTVKMGAE
ncbi:ABC transporter permease [Microbacterium deminutum]|uniref:ABC3 transporter permease C-terminal domain-containing protein n=1 Tax=Microbacterium deminutum TaxID=344164 RepID=A0ABN2R9K4_9MICO